MKILFVNLNHIGDMIFTLPAADALLSKIPDAEIVHLASEATLPLVRHDPRFSEVVSRPRKGFAEWMRIALALRRRHRFDASISFSRNSFGLGMASFLAGAPIRIGFDDCRDTRIFFNRRITYDEHAHRVANNVRALEPLGIVPDALPPMRIHLPSDAKEAAGRLLQPLRGEGPLVALCVGASVPRKKWEMSRFIALSERLHRERGARFALIGGEEDRVDAEAFLRGANVPALSFCGSAGIMESAALLAACDLAVGGDTGPIQLAISVDTPIVALYGSTEPRHTGPYQARGEMVFHALPCCGCSLSVPCPIEIECMNGIRAEEAYDAATRTLDACGSLLAGVAQDHRILAPVPPTAAP